MQIGYHLSSEELTPSQMLAAARAAENAGFAFITVSDHYHPWTHRQGQSPFVWGVIGGIAAVTERIDVGTAVTCPTVRIHPAVIAQAAATAAVMLPGRFFLGVGTGEALNEHILGDRWPSSGVRREMLEEAIEVIRLLWQGGSQSHFGRHYTVEQAAIFTLPAAPPPIVVSGFGDHSIDLAARVGDGYFTTAPDAEAVGRYRAGGGTGPCYSKLDVAIAESAGAARRLALRTWPNSALGGELAQILPLPAHFEQATENVTEDMVAESILCEQDPGAHVERLKEYADAGYDRVTVQQVGVDQARFLEMYERSVLPALAGSTAAALMVESTPQ
jgi:G6PDH family F420-dependent oxidoreductase